MCDYISRQVANEYFDLYRHSVLSTDEITSMIPAAPVREAKRGEKMAIKDEYGIAYYVCPECHSSIDYWYNFCPYCGAEMRGKNDEKNR